ncbi:bacteriohemerythrin [Motiliproteus sp. SC1-56]|uniref:bacteriohemerythrin n=1 Tax=Motiliproteus sp. SC1-56 TaxID=2799565 RepID=UPI001A8CEC8C|nr:bacteriohemerythrin [Motiliproteus sp. SC1-56]
MSKFVFDDSLRLGITLIDEQHSRFIGYINDTWDALERGDSSAEFLPILNQLLDYVVEHFSCEEALMREHGYPGYRDHKERHNQTAAELFDFDLRLLVNDREESAAFLNFLTAWLRNHILVVDKELATFLRDKGIS